VLRSLLERRSELVSELVAEAEGIARAVVADVDAEAVAEDVEQAVLGLDLEDLSSRAGRHAWGYVEPTEAAWEILGEAVEPFFQEMRRHIELGMETAAAATCSGIVLGLYRCREPKDGDLLSWAQDFPMETAGHAGETLARASRAKQRRAWQLPAETVDQVPGWARLFGRPSKKSPRPRKKR